MKVASLQLVHKRCDRIVPILEPDDIFKPAPLTGRRDIEASQHQERSSFDRNSDCTPQRLGYAIAADPRHCLDFVEDQQGETLRIHLPPNIREAAFELIDGEGEILLAAAPRFCL